MTYAISKTPLVSAWVRDLQIDEKYEYLLRDYTWCLSNGNPMTSNPKRKDGSRKIEGFESSVKLHQLIMYLEYGKKPDSKTRVRHNNHDSLDNRLENLAFSNPSDKALDRKNKKGANPTSNGKWRAQATLNGKQYNGKARETKEEAQRDYDMVTAMYDYMSLF